MTQERVDQVVGVADPLDAVLGGCGDLLEGSGVTKHKQLAADRPASCTDLQRLYATKHGSGLAACGLVSLPPDAAVQERRSR